MKNIGIQYILFLATGASLFAGVVDVDYTQSDLVQKYAVSRLKEGFRQKSDYPNVRVRFNIDESIGSESYRTTVTVAGKQLHVRINGGDSDGVLYGAMNLLEQLRATQTVGNMEESARFSFRALKFNLPWISYRDGKALRLHDETCRKLEFWESFMDMMVDNRFNTLTLWSLHPFHLMVRNTEYPEACDLSEQELSDWQDFWHALFFKAKERGIETYIVNWNIFTSPSFAKRHQLQDYLINPSPNYFGPGDDSQIIKDYMRTTITQVIDTYPNLTGLGASLGERDKNLTPAHREQFILDTFVAGMKEAKRNIRFIHRLPFGKGSQSSGVEGLTTEQLTRRTIESLDLPTTVITEAKFNWSHGHSSPKLIKIHGGKIGNIYWNPPPTNYEMHWMLRNEDFFALRWCEPDFIRRHIELNGHDYVGGYYVGSECYIPAKDYMTDPAFTSGYAFERQWLYYMAWGRLLYNPDLTDELFINACRERYGDAGPSLFAALKLGSRMPLRLATMFDFSWDYTLYSEGFLSVLAESNPEHFITVEELSSHETLDPDYLSVTKYCQLLKEGKRIPDGKISPLMLADQLTEDGNAALTFLKPLISKDNSKDLTVELVDAQAWAYLSLYFAEKLRAAIAYKRFGEEQNEAQGAKAVQALRRATHHWIRLAAVTEPVYVEMPLAHIYRFDQNAKEDKRTFHWKKLLAAVKAEQKRVERAVGAI
jgi:hypothetical protein